MSSTFVLAFAATLTLLLRLLLGGGPRSVINAAWNGLPVQDITNWRVPDDAGLAVLIDARASRDGSPSGRLHEHGPVQFFTLHFQGNSKKMIHDVFERYIGDV